MDPVQSGRSYSITKRQVNSRRVPAVSWKANTLEGVVIRATTERRLWINRGLVDALTVADVYFAGEREVRLAGIRDGGRFSSPAQRVFADIA